MSDGASELAAARTVYFAARRIVTNALSPLADGESDLERLLDLVGTEDLMWWNAQALARNAAADADGWRLDPALLVYITVGTDVEWRRHSHAWNGTIPTSAEWNRFADAVRACVDAIGGTPERLHNHELDLSPPPAPTPHSSTPPRSQTPTVHGDGKPATTRRLAEVVGAITGVVVGLFAWPLIAAIAATGPVSPYGPVGSPLGILEQWWVWLVSVGGGGALGWWLASGWASRH